MSRIVSGLQITRTFTKTFFRMDGEYQTQPNYRLQTGEQIVENTHFIDCAFDSLCCSYKFVNCVFDHCEGMKHIVNDGASGLCCDLQWAWNKKKTRYLSFVSETQKVVFAYPRNQDMLFEARTDFCSPYDRANIRIEQFITKKNHQVMYTQPSGDHFLYSAAELNWNTEGWQSCSVSVF